MMRHRTCQIKHQPVITFLYVPANPQYLPAAPVWLCHNVIAKRAALKSMASSAGPVHRLDAVLTARLLVTQVEDVITQVTRRDQLPAANRTAPYPKATEQDGVDSRITWRTKLRSLLCCLAPPQNDQYFRSNEAEAVVIRPPRAAVPPPRPPGDCDKACSSKLTNCRNLPNMLFQNSINGIWVK